MIIKVNGVPNWWKGPITQVVENNVQSPWELIVDWFTDKADQLFAVINANSSDVITLGIVVCAFGVMISPITGSSSKWLGKLFLVSWVGVIWRVLT